MAKELNFNFGSSTVSQGRNQIRFTAQLNTISNQRATEALRAATENPDLFKMANDVFDSGDANQLFDFLNRTVGHNLEADALFLDGATDKEFDSMLESRRSDRSKTKAKGPRNSMDLAVKYLATGYAEQLVRLAWNKPYDATSAGAELDTTDVDALNKKIKSLQSKKSRLTKLVELGDQAAQNEYKAVVDEIDRLSSFRPTTRTTSQTVLKDSIDTNVLRQALTAVDTSKLTEEEAQKLADLMARLG